MPNYYIGRDGNVYSEDELRHWGIPGMKWGVRRFQNKDGSLTAAGKKRRYVTDLSDRKTSKYDDPAERKKRIDADIKEADDRVKFYGSKRAAKAAIKDEANYAINRNIAKSFMDTVKWGGGSAAVVTAVHLAAGGTAAALAPGLAVPIAVASAVNGVLGARANRFVAKHASGQIAYTNESEYGHDMVVTMKKTK